MILREPIESVLDAFSLGLFLAYSGAEFKSSWVELPKICLDGRLANRWVIGNTD